MMNMENCFYSHGAELLHPVTFKGEVIAHLRPLRIKDADLLSPLLGRWAFDDQGRRYFDTSLARPSEYQLTKLCIMLGGTINGVSQRIGNEGWTSDRPITIDTLNELHNDVFMCFMQAVTEAESATETHIETLRKNSELPSV